jgi:hypothetical protein
MLRRQAGEVGLPGDLGWTVEFILHYPNRNEAWRERLPPAAVSGWRGSSTSGSAGWDTSSDRDHNPVG